MCLITIDQMEKKNVDDGKKKQREAWFRKKAKVEKVRRKENGGATDCHSGFKIA